MPLSTREKRALPNRKLFVEMREMLGPTILERKPFAFSMALGAWLASRGAAMRRLAAIVAEAERSPLSLRSLPRRDHIGGRAGHGSFGSRTRARLLATFGRAAFTERSARLGLLRAIVAETSLPTSRLAAPIERTRPLSGICDRIEVHGERGNGFLPHWAILRCAICVSSAALARTFFANRM